MKFGLPKIKLKKDLTVLLIAVFILHIGSFLVTPVLPVILNVDKDLNASQIGVIIGVGSLSVQVGSLMGGLLSDKIGIKITLVIGAIIQAFAMFGYGISDTYSAFILFSIISGIGGGVYGPTIKASIASIAADSTDTRTTAFSLRGISAHAGVALAGIITVLLAKRISNFIFFSAAIVFIVLAIITAIFISNKCRDKICPKINMNSYKSIFKNKQFLIFSGLAILVWIIYAQLTLLLPLRASAVLNNGKVVGLIWTITSIIFVIAQTYIANRFLKKVNLFKSIYIGVLIMGLGIFFIGFSHSFFILTLSATIFTIGEMLVTPTMDSLTGELASEEIIGAYFSISNLIFGLGSAIGNFICGKIINTYGIVNNLIPWLIFAIFAVIVSIVIIFISRLPLNGKNIKKEL
ncbi:MAG: major facilitator superfamily 1 [Haloplasmataceae bacterium]|jgi:MFS family permease|nr:major facilitator superfamily 1 [Haloplasmataceae bacterium]